MRRVTHIIFKADQDQSVVKGTVTLNFEDRFRRRIRLHDDAGEAFLLDLSHATRFEDGDDLALSDGGVLKVVAAQEDVLDVTGKDNQHTARLAWHIGNRHTPIEVLKSGELRIQYDHVLLHMLEGLGATTQRASAPFVPESGAYDNTAQGASHDHAHG
ncbi:MAG: Urease accessory protein UreE [Rhodospirillaceae bacterium]|nr:MAG: Urease accessory protein UreE [Rhodospirillaceae bacterium]